MGYNLSYNIGASVYGGAGPGWYDDGLNTGARYNPVTDTWTPMSTINAPRSRYNHTAVWTGTEMIVWGGEYGGSTAVGLDTGARYNPTTNTNAPTPI